MWERSGDKKLDKGFNNFIIKTILPIKKYHHFTNVNAQIIVEKQIVEWAKQNGFSGQKKKYMCENINDTDSDFFVIMFEGKLYDFKLDGYILVE